MKRFAKIILNDITEDTPAYKYYQNAIGKIVEVIGETETEYELLYPDYYCNKTSFWEKYEVELIDKKG